MAFVGRERQLLRLLGALGGDARMVLVVGDAGVGKTRFAGEGMARAAAAGMVMVRGECLPLAEKLPLLPVAGALDCLTYLARAGGGAATVVATCRSDEAPLDQHVAEWLAHVRGGDVVEEIRRRGLSMNCMRVRRATRFSPSSWPLRL